MFDLKRGPGQPYPQAKKGGAQAPLSAAATSAAAAALKLHLRAVSSALAAAAAGMGMKQEHHTEALKVRARMYELLRI